MCGEIILERGKNGVFLRVKGKIWNNKVKYEINFCRKFVNISNV